MRRASDSCAETGAHPSHEGISRTRPPSVGSLLAFRICGRPGPARPTAPPPSWTPNFPAARKGGGGFATAARPFRIPRKEAGSSEVVPWSVSRFEKPWPEERFPVRSCLSGGGPNGRPMVHLAGREPATNILDAQDARYSPAGGKDKTARLWIGYGRKDWYGFLLRGGKIPGPPVGVNRIDPAERASFRSMRPVSGGLDPQVRRPPPLRPCAFSGRFRWCRGSPAWPRTPPAVFAPAAASRPRPFRPRRPPKRR